MDGLERNELLQPAYITKVMDSISPDTEAYFMAGEVPLIEQENEMVIVDVRHQIGGMTLAVAEGAESPIIEQRGRHQWSFQPQQFREKVLLSEKDVKIIRKLGSATEVERAQQRITEILGDLRMRVETRMEWAKWQMTYGTLAIAQPDVAYSIDYHIPTEFKPTLTGVDLWSATTSDPMSDWLDWIDLYRDEGIEVDYFLFNSQVQKALLLNQKVRDLRDSLFSGQANLGNLTRGNLTSVFDAYAGVPAKTYDKGYYFVMKLDSAITNVTTTFNVAENPGVVAGDTVTVIHKSGEREGRVRIPITVASGTTLTHVAIGGTTTFPVGSTVRIKKRFLLDTSFMIKGKVPAGTTGGTNWAEYISTNHVYGPGGIQNPTPGVFSKVVVKDDDDPPRIEIIAGVNGLPVLYHPTTNVMATVL